MSSTTAVLDTARHDVLPGFVLSRPRWTDYAELEAMFGRIHCRAIMEAAGDLGPEVRREAIAVLSTDLRSRPYAWGRPGFDEAVYRPEVLPVLAWISIRVRHPQVTLADAEKLLADLSDDGRAEVRQAVLEMMGYTFGLSPKFKGSLGESEPIDFRKIYKVLRKRLSPNDIASLNMDQVLLELGIDTEEEEERQEATRLREERKVATLVKAAEVMNLAPSALAALPAEQIADAVAKATGTRPAPAMAKQAAEEWAKAT